MKQERCKICNKKSGLVPFKCEDKVFFCALHRHKHECNYDFKEKLIKGNPVIITKQLETY